jgi:hypothetical protein
MNTIVDVLNELDDGSTVDLVAKVVKCTDTTYTIRYLSPTMKLYGDQVLYAYEDETYIVDAECVSGFYDSTREEDAGFVKVEGGWIQDETDSEYQPSGSEPEDDDDDDEELVDSDEED